MKEVVIWTDGSSSGNGSGPGGYAAVICVGESEVEIGGGSPQTTNQKMELMAAITALEYLTEPTRVTVHTDSAYVCNCFLLGWWERWLTNGWLDSKKKPVMNRELWERLIRLNEFHQVTWCKVKGHSADFPMNERCDRLAAAQKKLHGPVTRAAADSSARAATAGRTRVRRAPAWKSLSDSALRAHLLATPTLPDSAWADLRAPGESRRPGESRADFVRRARLAAPAPQPGQASGSALST